MSTLDRPGQRLGSVAPLPRRCSCSSARAAPIIKRDTVVLNHIEAAVVSSINLVVVGP
jgi:hypothetical protein